ncbi:MULTISPECIES: DUF3014 domain-containing protein [unclassified Corallococcus]|uniref:DUF3014 domain-containing protein n=1 Tax=unclassified Corallococcus TaxID=2685029 RepID=UPI001A8F93D9|nr:MULTISPECIES: DUF3014 domain-containing protein [unclassified Corallococcus]MBN9685717.1 DUF3014 domain-containing protein [Corallococcus sp. NCSPR001]WAS82838.1 DUF3014 domain-containing protein [Corallococcus sp. NCRR]
MSPSENAPLPPSPLRSLRWPLGIAAAVALLGGSSYLLLRTPEPPPAPTPAIAEPTPPAPPAPPAVQLSGTDARVRELLKGLSGDADYARWLASEDLARRFAASVNLVAEGQSPRMPLSFMAPTGTFRVTKRHGHTVASPESHTRYDAVARVITSLDAKKAGQVYQELKPLLDAAHAELAPPGRSLDATLSQAIGRLTRVSIPKTPPELTPKGALYVYADPNLEALGAAEKHLLRMGPENMRKVQAKLTELAAGLGLPSQEQARRP